MNREMSEIIRHQKPLTLPPDTTVQEACKQMHARKVGAVLVINERSAAVGHLHRPRRRAGAGQRQGPGGDRSQGRDDEEAGLHAAALTAIEALRLMRDGGFRHVPVVQEGVVVGIVSRGDFRGLEQDRLDEETGIWERMR